MGLPRRVGIGFLTSFVAALALAGPVSAAPATVPAGANWSETNIKTADGTMLHADILRPKNVPAGTKVPVIVSVGPYFNRAGQEGAIGVIQGVAYDPLFDSGPSDRFRDFVDGAKLMQRGYAFVMVDLRGYGGSHGCLDWVGPGEQGDVKAAVEWAASQPWSNGRVGMYGKSYDASTGLVGVGLKPKGLRAVVAQEPVYDMYRYLYANGVRYPNAIGTPALYGVIALTPGPLLAPTGYVLDGITDPLCVINNLLAQQKNDHQAQYWKDRDLIALTRGSKVPLFLTQGFLENNTKPDGAWDLYNGVKGPKRAWFGMWDHVRGNDRDNKNRLKMGRAGFFDEVMRFYDEHVKGVKGATKKDPPVVVQTSDGTWRSEKQWPPDDSKTYTAQLRPGTYFDDGAVYGTGEGAASEGVWTVSPPLPHDAHFAGIPKAHIVTDPAAAGANLVVDIYDVDDKNSAILISRNTAIIPAGGPLDLELYGDDWLFGAGHRIAALVTSSNGEWWSHDPTNKDVAIRSGTLQLPFLRYTRPVKLPGTPALRLEEYRDEAPFTVPGETLAAGTVAGFPIPPVQVARPVPLRLKVSVKGRTLTISGTDDPKRKLKVVVARKGAKGVTRKIRASAAGKFKVKIKVSRKARYKVTVSGGGEKRAKAVRVKR